MSLENDASPDGSRRRPPDRSRRSALLLLSFLAFFLAFSTGCFGKRPSEAPIPTDPALRAAEIAELREAIDRDHATLEEWITRKGLEEADAPAGQPSLHEDPTLRAIAERLTRQERRLARLESFERERAERNAAADDGSAKSTGPVAPQ